MSSEVRCASASTPHVDRLSVDVGCNCVPVIETLAATTARIPKYVTSGVPPITIVMAAYPAPSPYTSAIMSKLSKPQNSPVTTTTAPALCEGYLHTPLTVHSSSRITSARLLPRPVCLSSPVIATAGSGRVGEGEQGRTARKNEMGWTHPPESDGVDPPT